MARVVTLLPSTLTEKTRRWDERDIQKHKQQMDLLWNEVQNKFHVPFGHDDES